MTPGHGSRGPVGREPRYLSGCNVRTVVSSVVAGFQKGGNCSHRSNPAWQQGPEGFVDYESRNAVDDAYGSLAAWSRMYPIATNTRRKPSDDIYEQWGKDS